MMKGYNFKINGHDYKVDIESVGGASAKVIVNGMSYDVEMSDNDCTAAADTAVTVPEAAAVKVERTSGSKSVVTPLPGVILEICVSKGDSVKAGQKVAVLEAMKMENDIESEVEGIVTAILAGKGDSLQEGAKIIELE